MSPSKLYHAAGEPVIVDDDVIGERAPMKRSFSHVDEIPKYEGSRPKVLLFEGSSVLHNRETFAHVFHEVFTKVFPEYRMPGQDEIMEAQSYSGKWPDILAHLGIPHDVYKARRKVSEDTYLQSFVDYDGQKKGALFSDCVRVLRAAKENGFVMILETLDTPLACQVLYDARATDIFDIYLDRENAWITRGPDVPPRPIESKDLMMAYDEFLKDKGIKVDGKIFIRPQNFALLAKLLTMVDLTGDNKVSLKPEDVMVVQGCIRELISRIKKGRAGALWGCKLCYVARTDAELETDLEALLDLEVEDLNEFGYSLFDLPLPATAPARPVTASNAAALAAGVTMEEVVEITDGEEEVTVVEEEGSV